MPSHSEPLDETRWLVVAGRRWRRTDPDLPDEVVSLLKSHLGRGRAAVKKAKHGADPDALSAARHRVGLAKLGLGERGPHWWDEPLEARRRQADEALRELDTLAPHTFDGLDDPDA